METFLKVVVGLVGVLGLAFAFALLLAYPIMWTWNYTFPELFGWPVIDVWQALWGALCMKLIFPSNTVSSG